jgi:crotonobetainyl-CoA:carnitine CoA-transferase CaiB-like acyl-CoA transferase
MQTDELMERLRAEQVPSAQVSDLDSVFVDPQVLHNDVVHSWEHPTAGPMRHAKPPVRFSHTSHTTVWSVDELGQSTEDVLREHGYDDLALEALRAVGVIR